MECQADQVRARILKTEDRDIESSRGFTLLELLLVLTVLGFALMWSGPSVQSLNESIEYRRALNEISSSLRLAKRQARLSGVSVDFLVDPTANLIAVSSNPHSVATDSFTQIPTELSINVVSASEMSPGGSLAAIRFYPSGGSSGGEVALMRRKTSSGVLFRVDWLLGDVSEERL